MATRYAGSSKEKNALNLFIKFMRASNTVNRKNEEFIREYELNPGQFGVLESLYHLGPMCQKDIANKLLSSEGNVTQLIDKLEKQKLVRRMKNREDRRFIEINLTEKGELIMKKIFPTYARKLTEMMGVLSEKEKKMMGDLCKKLGLELSQD